MHSAIIRTFFAIELPFEVQANIMKIMEQMKSNAPKTIKWVSRENLHITLKFLGAFNPEHVDLLRINLQQELNNFQPFNIILDRFGFYPNSLNPRVIWVGIHHSEEVSNLVQIIEKTTSSLGYPKETRTFHAHITLGRIKYSIGRNEIESINNYLIENKLQQIQFLISEVIFFQSDLRSSGPEYQRLISISL